MVMFGDLFLVVFGYNVDGCWFVDVVICVGVIVVVEEGDIFVVY